MLHSDVSPTVFRHRSYRFYFFSREEERAHVRVYSPSEAEVLSIDRHGLWLMADSREHFLAFDHFPWFRNATVASILNVQILHLDHLRWPDLDVDLSVDMLDHPEDYPLVFA